MADTDIQTQIAAAKAYENLFVPAVFGQWADNVVEAAGIRSGDRVLDVACGTGVLGRCAARRVAPGGSVAGVDINPGMIEVARQLAPDIEWREAAAEKLPYPEESFDAVVSQFGLMFFSDRVESVREMMRVLVPNGRLCVAVFDSLNKQPAYAREAEMLERIVGQPAADALRAPFALGDKRDLERLFTDAAASIAEISTHNGRGRFPSVRSMVEADLRGWLPVMGIQLTEEQIAAVLEAAEAVLQNFVDAHGEVKFELSAHLVSTKKIDAL